MASYLHAEAFREAIVHSTYDHPHRKDVHIYTVPEYARMRLWLAPDSMGGAAVTEDGDLVSVFRHPNGESISDILREASLAARTLDCFDTNGFLPDLYRGYGFVPTSILAFDPELAPEGWDVDADGTPNVILMLHERFVRQDIPPVACGSWDGAEYVREYVAGNNRGEYPRI